jgi:hypothetical protein
MVEAARELRHFIPPFDLDTDGKIASSKGFDLCLQPFESSRDTPHNGIGPQRNGNGQQAQRSQQAHSAMRPLPAGHHKPTVWQGQGNRWASAPGPHPSRRHMLWQRCRQRGAACSEEGAISTMYGEIDRQQASEMLYCTLQLTHWAFWPW